MAKPTITIISISKSFEFERHLRLALAVLNHQAAKWRTWPGTYLRGPAPLNTQRMEDKGMRAGASPSQRASQLGETSWPSWKTGLPADSRVSVKR